MLSLSVLSAAGDPMEIWSLRQAALQLLGAVLSGHHHGTFPCYHIGNDNHRGGNDDDSPEGNLNTMMPTVMVALTQCAGDLKHSKLRVAALKCLERIVRGAMTTVRSDKEKIHDQTKMVHAGDILVQTYRDEVRAVLRTAATDAQPAVLEAAGKTQECWLSLLSSSSSR